MTSDKQIEAIANILGGAFMSHLSITSYKVNLAEKTAPVDMMLRVGDHHTTVVAGNKLPAMKDIEQWL